MFPFIYDTSLFKLELGIPTSQEKTLPRTLGREAFWRFSIITSVQLNWEFVPAPSTENTESQIIPLEEQG